MFDLLSRLPTVGNGGAMDVFTGFCTVVAVGDTGCQTSIARAAVDTRYSDGCGSFHAILLGMRRVCFVEKHALTCSVRETHHLK